MAQREMRGLMDSSATGREIAIIGMAGRFPGAGNVDEFWTNLKAGVESIVDVTADDLKASGIDPAIFSDPAYVRRAAPLDDAECFDASFFGYSPKEAELMDPQHRVFLECAWAAMEDAGYDSEKYPGLIGVFGGVARNSYLVNNIAAQPDLLKAAGDYRILLGNDKDFPAARVAYLSEGPRSTYKPPAHPPVWPHIWPVKVS
jgi:acyl transferase domain-containing protein